MSRTAGATDYSPTEIDAALTTLVYFGGNAARASEATGIPQSTLKVWKTNAHRDRYSELAEKEGPKLEAIAAQQARETILRAGETEAQLFDILHSRMSEDAAPEPQADDFPTETLYLLAYERWLKRGSSKELSELAGTVQRISTAKGINGTKLLELTGRPTQIVEHRDPKQEAQALARRLGVALEATAVEIHQAQLPASAQPSLVAENGSANARELPAAQQASAPSD